MSEIDILIREFERAYLKSLASPWGNVAYHVHDHHPEMKNIRMYLRFRTQEQCLWNRPVLVLATIDVTNPGQGEFSKLLARTKDLCRQRDWILQVENVLTPKFRKFLQRGGFKPFGIDAEVPYGSLYWFHDETIPQQCAMYRQRERT